MARKPKGPKSSLSEAFIIPDVFARYLQDQQPDDLQTLSSETWRERVERDVGPQVRARLRKVLPEFITVDLEATDFVLLSVAQYMESDRRAGAEELRLSELNSLVSQVSDATKTLLEAQASLAIRLMALTRGPGPGSDVLDAMLSAIKKFDAAVHPIKDAERAAASLLNAIPITGKDRGGTPLSVQLRGNRLTKLGERLAIVYGEKGRDITEPREGFLPVFRAMYHVLEGFDPDQPDLPGEAGVMADINRFFRSKFSEAGRSRLN